MKAFRLPFDAFPAFFAVCLAACVGFWGVPALRSQSASPVKSIHIIDTNGGRLDWGPNNLIAFDRLGPGNTYDIWTMDMKTTQPDASHQICLTCNKAELPLNHRGNPAWHPSGHYIVFQVAQKRTAMPLGPRFDALIDQVSRPGGGFRNDLWLMDSTGSHFWRLTSEPRQGGVLHPHFSHDGKRLFWAERLGGNNTTFGNWTLHLADFAIVNGTPKLTNIQSVPPGAPQGFYESHGFDPSDHKIIYTANSPTGPELGLDIFTYDLFTHQIVNLTQSPQTWDEHAHYSPSGKTIIWASSQGNPLPTGRDWATQLRMDLWIMNADGSGKQKATHFAEPGTPLYEPERAVTADSDWSPDGTRVAGLLQFTPTSGRAKIFVIEFAHPM